METKKTKNNAERVPKNKLAALDNFSFYKGESIDFDIYNAEGALIHPAQAKMTEDILHKVENWEAIYLLKDQYENYLEVKKLSNYKGDYKPGDKMAFSHKVMDQALDMQNDIFHSITENSLKASTVEDMIDFVDAEAVSVRDNLSHKNCYVNLLNVLKEHDDYTFRHSANVGLLSLGFVSLPGIDSTLYALAQRYQVVGPNEKLSTEQIYNRFVRNVALGGFFHDIGKAHIAREILNKNGKLSDFEMEQMKGHPQKGVEILSEQFGQYDDIFIEDVKDMILYHHLRFTEQGYPEQVNMLKQNRKIFFPRITALVDVFDALTSERSYKKAWSAKEALIFIWNQKARHFDPVFAILFLKHYSKGLNKGDFFYGNGDWAWFHTRGDDGKLAHIHLGEIIEENELDLHKPKVKLIAEVQEEKGTMVLRKNRRQLEIDLSKDRYLVGDRRMMKILEVSQKEHLSKGLF